LFVYDVTRPESFKSIKALVTEWQEFIPNKRSSDFIILIGNKCDLNHARQVSAQVGEAFAKEHGFVFLETVANTVPGLQKFEDVLVQKFQNSVRCFHLSMENGALDIDEDAAQAAKFASDCVVRFL
jgi:Ras-related protein Rab-2A